MTPSLTSAILRYKADWYSYLALNIEAEERGENVDHIVYGYDADKDVIATWDRPAQSLPEAMEALRLAVEDYEIGDTPRISAMMKAALRWMKAEYKLSSGEDDR